MAFLFSIPGLIIASVTALIGTIALLVQLFQPSPPSELPPSLASPSPKPPLTAHSESLQSSQVDVGSDLVDAEEGSEVEEEGNSDSRIKRFDYDLKLNKKYLIQFDRAISNKDPKNGTLDWQIAGRVELIPIARSATSLNAIVNCSVTKADFLDVFTSFELGLIPTEASGAKPPRSSVPGGAAINLASISKTYGELIEKHGRSLLVKFNRSGKLLQVARVPGRITDKATAFCIENIQNFIPYFKSPNEGVNSYQIQNDYLHEEKAELSKYKVLPENWTFEPTRITATTANGPIKKSRFGKARGSEFTPAASRSLEILWREEEHFPNELTVNASVSVQNNGKLVADGHNTDHAIYQIEDLGQRLKSLQSMAPFFSEAVPITLPRLLQSRVSTRLPGRTSIDLPEMLSEVFPFLDDKYKDQQKEIMWNLARMLDSSPLLVERFEPAMKELEPESTGVRLMIAALGHLCSARAQEILGSRAVGNSTTASDARIALAMCPEPLTENTFKRLNQLYISTPPSDLKKEYGYVIGSALRNGDDLNSILTLKKAWLDVERQVPAIHTSDLKEGLSEVLDASLESSEGGTARTDPSTKETRASDAEVRVDSSISGIPVDESYVEQRVGILEAFGNSGRDEFLPEIIAALMSDVPALQASALDSLRFHRSNKARDLLFEFLNEPNLPETVKAVGYETLKWQLSDSRSVPALQNCRDTGSDTLKKTCNEILESIDSGDLSEDKEDES